MTTEKITADGRDWAELPWDALSIVFEKVGPFDVLIAAQQVCSQWWKFAHDPRAWTRIDFTGIYYDHEICYDHAKMALAVVNRSNGGLVEFAFAEYGNDDLLKRIAETSTQLKVLRLIGCGEVSYQTLMEACESFPLLEELEISHSMSLTSAALESVGHSCPHLKKFRFNCTKVRFTYSLYNNEALAISKHMPELRELQLIGNKLDNNGLCALLDGCRYLESLDIRRCFQLDLGGDLKRRCQGLRFLRLPKDSIEDFPYAEYYTGSEYDTDSDYVDDGFDDPEMYGDFYPEFYDFNDPEMYGDFYPEFYGLDDPETFDDFTRVPGLLDVDDMFSYMVFPHEDNGDDILGADFGF